MTPTLGLPEVGVFRRSWGRLVSLRLPFGFVNDGERRVRAHFPRSDHRVVAERAIPVDAVGLPGVPVRVEYDRARREGIEFGLLALSGVRGMAAPVRAHAWQ